jgi:beta-lactamase class C
LQQKKKYRIKQGFAIFAAFGVLSILVSWQPNFNSPDFSGTTPDSLATGTPEICEIEPVLFDYDSLLSSELKKSANVGAAAAVIYNNEIVYLKCFGVKKAGTKDSIDAQTLFRLASVSKTISGILAGKMVADERTYSPSSA